MTFKPDTEWLNTLNTTALTHLVFMAGLGWTAIVWGVATLAGLPIEPGAFGLWLGALGAVRLVNHMTQKNYRETDYGYQERQAQIEAAKAQAAQPTTVTVAQVNTTEEVK